MFEFKFPDVGEGITEGTIVKWKVMEGDSVKADQIIADIETDKAVVEVPCPKTGKIVKISHKEGDVIKVGEVLLVIDEGLSLESPSASAGKEPYTGSVVGFLEEAKGKEEKKEEVHKEAKDKVMATLKIRKLAEQLRIDITKIKGTGENGRITEDDLKVAKPSETLSAKPAEKPSEKTASISASVPISKTITGESIPLKGIRKTIADAMIKSEGTTVAVTNFYDLDITALWEKRSKEKVAAEKKNIKLTFLAYFAKNIAATLKAHPLLNSSIEGENIVLKKVYNIGVAVDTEQGLMVPVIKDADKKDLFAVAKEIVDLAEKAKNQTIKTEEMKNGTFTISNLGSVGVKYFTPVINYPESAILGLGSIEEKLKVINGTAVFRKVMPLSLTYDHRHVDGATAARFMIDLMKTFE